MRINDAGFMDVNTDVRCTRSAFEIDSLQLERGDPSFTLHVKTLVHVSLCGLGGVPVLR